MAGNHTKKYKEKQRKKVMKALFGKSLPIVIVLLVFLAAAFGYLYESSEPFRDFVNDLGIFTEDAPTAPFIDPNGQEMAIHFIDVGQGDAALLQTSSGSVLIDCGESDQGSVVVSYLKSQGVTELEYFIITHPDSDHMGCAAYVLENIKVKNFVINGKEKTAKFFEKALDAMETRGVNGIIAQAGDRFEIGALALDVLGPVIDDINDLDSNDSSLIIYATYGSKNILFTGDAEKEGEALLLEHSRNSLKCDIFSAGHHGAKTSNSLALLQAAKPQFVVVSCGADNSYGHPTTEAMNNFAAVGATVYRTDKLGTIVFVTDGVTLTKK